MIDAISASTPLRGFQVPGSVQAPTEQSAQADVPQGDLVQLSDAAQAKLLKQEGFDVTQIAIKLGLDQKTVATYFPSIDSKA